MGDLEFRKYLKLNTKKNHRIINPEEPHLLLLNLDNGTNLISYNFQDTLKYDPQLISGAFDGFLRMFEEIFPNSYYKTDQLKKIHYNQFVILVLRVDPITLVYIFEGTEISHLALLLTFANSLKRSKYWTYLNNNSPQIYTDVERSILEMIRSHFDK